MSGLNFNDLSRITPACAGKTVKFLGCWTPIWDHPRVCGKDVGLNLSLIPIRGSPPRVRERQKGIDADLTNPGITPACAGKTANHAIIFCVSRDHPRVCGKDCRVSSKSSSKQGSPPRVRERQGFTATELDHYRITPACAGKTHLSSCGIMNLKDHPRVCGKDLH